jgi:hypothetical protein
VERSDAGKEDRKIEVIHEQDLKKVERNPESDPDYVEEQQRQQDA